MSNLTTAQLTELQGYVTSGNRISYWTKLSEFQAQMHITDIASVRGQETAKRTLEIAAAGGHNLLRFKRPVGVIMTLSNFYISEVRMFK